MLTQQLQEGTPLAGFFRVVHVASGGVQQHRFGAEEPITVARPAQTGHPCAFALGIREVEPRLVDHRALAGGRLPNYQVPGQGVQCVFGRGCARLVAVQALQALQQAFA
ncbi:hypothetical protein D3C79_625210 [compost metagenome]